MKILNQKNVVKSEVMRSVKFDDSAKEIKSEKMRSRPAIALLFKSSALCFLALGLFSGCSNAWNKNPKVTGVLAGEKVISQADVPADTSIRLRDDVASFKEGAEETATLRFATYQADKIKSLDFELKLTGELDHIERTLEKYGDGQYKLVLKWKPPEFLVPRKQDTAEYPATLRLLMKTQSDNILEKEFQITIKVFKNILRPEVVGYIRYEDIGKLDSKEAEDKFLLDVAKTDNKFLVPSVIEPEPEMTLPVEPQDGSENAETPPKAPPLDESTLKNPSYLENESSSLYIIVDDPESKSDLSLRLPPVLSLLTVGSQGSRENTFQYVQMGDDAGKPSRSTFNPNIWYFPVNLKFNGVNLTDNTKEAEFSVEARSQHDPKVLSKKLTVVFDILDNVKEPVSEWVTPVIFSTAQLNNYIFRVSNPDGEGSVAVYFTSQCKDYGMRCLCDEDAASSSQTCYVQWTPPLNSPEVSVTLLAASFSKRMVNPLYVQLPEYKSADGSPVTEDGDKLVALRSAQVEITGKIRITSDGKPIVAPPAAAAKPVAAAPKPTHKPARER